MAKDDFYIGYRPDNEKAFFSKTKKIVFATIIIAAVFALAFIGFSGAFPNSVFELGKQTELEGYLRTSPYASLIVGDPQSVAPSEVLLVAFGKFGGKQLLKEIEESKGVNLHGRRVKIQGTLIHGEGRTLLEMTDKANSLTQIYDEKITVSSPKADLSKKRTLSGEIIDPKCYFGVMKPGRGKPHKSCAIRCISGGIPPVFKASFDDGHSEYFIILDHVGREINQRVLDYVADPIMVSGVVTDSPEWKVLYLDPDKGIRRLEQ